jgi:hypothetical protein
MAWAGLLLNSSVLETEPRLQHEHCEFRSLHSSNHLPGKSRYGFRGVALAAKLNGDECVSP